MDRRESTPGTKASHPTGFVGEYVNLVFTIGKGVWYKRNLVLDWQCSGQVEAITKSLEREEWAQRERKKYKQ